MMPGIIKQERGFSLIELMIATLVGTLVLGLVCSTFLFQNKSYDVQGQITNMVQTARATMDIMTREIRMAGYNPAEVSFNGIPYNTSKLQVLADLNGDGDTDEMEESISYMYNATNLAIYRDRGDGAFYPLATQVESFKFNYLAKDGSNAASAADIRQIQVILSFRTEKPDPDFADNNGYRTFTLSSFITPKNLDIL